MMKVIYCLVLAVLFGCGFSQAEDRKAYDAMLTIQVVDELGQPISLATVAASTLKMWHQGEGFGRDENIVVTGVTDTNGLTTLEVPCRSGTVSIGTQNPTNYYKTYSKKFIFTKTEDDKWLPWNQTEKFVLKRIVNPIPLYVKQVNLTQFDGISITEQQLGFDLVKGDWVAPQGTGETPDFIFKINRKLGGMTKSNYQIHDSSLLLEFYNGGDGIQSFYAKSREGSQLRLPRLAPINGYETNLVRSAYEHIDGSFEERREDQNYFFRIRTKKDDEGNIVSALYGKIYGPFTWRWDGKLRFTYYLNPTPNDRNLEFNTSQNLFSGKCIKEP